MLSHQHIHVACPAKCHTHLEFPLKFLPYTEAFWASRCFIYVSVWIFGFTRVVNLCLGVWFPNYSNGVDGSIVPILKYCILKQGGRNCKSPTPWLTCLVLNLNIIEMVRLAGVFFHVRPNENCVAQTSQLWILQWPIIGSVWAWWVQ